MALTQFGEQTKSVFLKSIESHKLHQEFEVKAGVSVKQGQPLKLVAADGTVEPAAAGDKANLIIGVAVQSRAAGELVTVGMKAFTIVWAQSLGALVAGPVKMAAAPADPLYCGYEASTAVDQATTPALDYSDVVGWALDAAAGAGELVRVAIL